MTLKYLNSWEDDIRGNGAFKGVQIDCTERLQLVTDVVRSGRQALRVEVRDGDNASGSLGERAEVCRMLDTTGNEIRQGAHSGTQVFSFSVNLAADWVAPSGYGIIWQLHNELPSCGSEPVIAFNAGESFGIRVSGGDISDIESQKVQKYDLLDGSLNVGQWVDFVMKIKFSENSDGQIDVWRRDEGEQDFQKVLELHTATQQVYNGAILDQYHKAGLYQNASDTAASRVLWLDDMLIGETVGEVVGALNNGASADWIEGNGGGDRIIASDTGETIDGGDGADTVIGGDGADVLFGSMGNDALFGGGGNDQLDGGAGDDNLSGQGGSDTLTGGAGNDTIAGGSLGDLIAGGDGNDNILAWAGNDQVTGDAGDDVADGGEGADTLDGGVGNDTLLGNTGNDQLSGGDGADSLAGASGNDILRGGSGNDTLTGADGTDNLDGGTGNDRLDGGGGRDTLYGASGQDSLWGGSDDDLVYGDDGNDWIDAGSGNDVVYGGTGNDIINGGSGADILAFSGAFGSDAVNGFTHGTDRIRIEGYGLDLNTFSELRAYLRIDGTDTVIDLTPQGGGIIDVIGVRNLDAGDFLFVA